MGDFVFFFIHLYIFQKFSKECTLWKKCNINYKEMVLIVLGWTMSIVVDFPASVSTQLIGLKHQTNSQGPFPLPVMDLGIGMWPGSSPMRQKCKSDDRSLKGNQRWLSPFPSPDTIIYSDVAVSLRLKEERTKGISEAELVLGEPCLECTYP